MNLSFLYFLKPKPRTLDDEISRLESQTLADAQKLAKVQRIAALQQAHKVSVKRIAQYPKSQNKMYLIILVLGFVLLFLVMKGCK